MSPEQKALVQKARSSLEAARMLTKEGHFDFGTSRAYYTMFYIAQAFLLCEGLSFSRHAGVIAAFGQYFAKTDRLPREYHRFLIEAADSRNIGDYDIGPGISREESAKQIERAEKFIVLFEEFMQSS